MAPDSKNSLLNFCAYAFLGSNHNEALYRSSQMHAKSTRLHIIISSVIEAKSESKLKKCQPVANCVYLYRAV